MTDRVSPVAQHHRLEEEWRDPPGNWGRLAAVNHTTIGKRFIVTALVFFLIGGVLAMLIRAQLATSGNAFLDHAVYNQIFTMHGTMMMFLFAIPMLEGYALYLLPKMLGSRDLAYPRLGAYAYWCYVFGGLILLGALLAGVAPDSGWFMYTPLSGKVHSPGINADVWLIGVTFAEISAICGAIELIATILTMRAPGMSLDKMPLFAWYMLVTAAMILVGFPPLILGSILLELERAFGWPFFEVALGGDPLLWQHLFWMFGHPEVYIIFLPAAGMVATMVPVFARHPIVGYRWIVGAIVLLAVLSFGLWVHHMFTVGIPHLALSFFSVASMMVAIPTGVQLFSWLATLWSGRPRFTLPMLYLAGFLVVFVCGGLTGVMLALVPFNWQAHDTHFVVAHLHYVLVGGLVFPLLAGLYYWMPHVSGRMPSPVLGRYAFWLIFIGFNVTFLPMHLTGLVGMPRRVYTYPGDLGWDMLNLVSSIGSFVMAAGFAMVILDVIIHVRTGPKAPRNPWEGDTLEWATGTPVPAYNFASLPVVSSRHPLWEAPDLGADLAAGRGVLAQYTPGVRETLGVEVLSGRPRTIIRVPGPSYVPFVAAVVTGVFFGSLLAKVYWITPLAALVVLALFLCWAAHTGLPRRFSFGREVLGEILPTHHARRGSPGEWGVSLCLVADSAVLGSLLFGYVFLWLVAENWPPLHSADLNGVAVAVVLVASAVAWWVAARHARRTGLFMDRPETTELAMRNTAAYDLALPSRGPLLVSMLAWVVALVALLVLWRYLPDPTGHAYAAVTSVLLCYAMFHVCVAAVMTGFNAWRSGRLDIAPVQRGVDARVLHVWSRYVLSSTVIVLGAIAGMRYLGGV